MRNYILNEQLSATVFVLFCLVYGNNKCRCIENTISTRCNKWLLICIRTNEFEMGILRRRRDWHPIETCLFYLVMDVRYLDRHLTGALRRYYINRKLTFILLQFFCKLDFRLYGEFQAICICMFYNVNNLLLY